MTILRIKHPNYDKMTLDLTAEEQQMFELLHPFTIGLDEPDELRKTKLKASGRLMLSLLDRNVIPKVRIKYFTQPEYNVLNSRKSRQQVFEHNGRVGTGIFEGPAFLKYLKYFICGAELPWDLKVDLQAAKSNAYYETEFLDEACTVVSRHRGSGAADHDQFAEELFKHALDMGVELAISKRLWEIIRK